MTVTTDDGVRLAGWYLPSTNRAAVVLLHGAGSTRSDVLDEAAVLARHGFGVLMIDARGHGDSAGRAMDFGWHGDADIAAATGYLADRPDVDRQRIGVVGMSMGGEEALGATATNDLIRAVIAEGATARNAADEAWLSDQFGVRGLVQVQLERLQDVATDALTSASVPPRCVKPSRRPETPATSSSRPARLTTRVAPPGTSPLERPNACTSGPCRTLHTPTDSKPNRRSGKRVSSPFSPTRWEPEVRPSGMWDCPDRDEDDDLVGVIVRGGGVRSSR